jgi:3-phenylpropionate/cinnamic acid dioxygenase small subunit
MVDEHVRREVEQFLYKEAQLLDERRFHEWLELFSDDVHYWAPLRITRMIKDTLTYRPLNPQSPTEREDELTQADEVFLFDEDKQSLTMRVARLDTRMAWAEDPPSRTRHLITNFQIEEGKTAKEFTVYSNFITFRGRMADVEEFFVGRREDILRKTADGWHIARRKIIFDQNVVGSQNFSIFF